MPYDGNGNFVRVHNWAADAANALDINATEMDQEDNGIAAALSVAVTRDGQGKMAVDFLPNADNTLNLGSASRRWASLNGAQIPSGNTPWTFYPATAAEIAAAVTPSVFSYAPLNPFRYGADGTGGANDTTALTRVQSVLAQMAGISEWLNGLIVGACAQNSIERSVGVTIVNWYYPCGHAFRYGAVGDGTTIDNVAVQAVLNVSIGYQAIARTAAQRNIPAGYFPSGSYLVTTPLTIPNAASIRCENDAWFFYNDTVTPGSYLFTAGAAGAGIGGIRWDCLRINLLTVTGKGLNLINCQDSDFPDIYCQGLVLSNWASNIAGMTARTNVGLRIEATAGQQSFWNRFGNLHINHCHTGILVPDSGGFVGQHEVRFLNLFGDATFNDQGAKGVDAVAGQDWIIHGGYVESYYNAAGVGGIKLATAKCVRWKTSKVVFDVGGSPSGIMNGIVLAGPGAPSSNQFMQCMIDPATIAVSDGTTAVNGNLIENNPNIASIWTATLVPSTGTITLNSGVGGDTCFCVKRGNEVHVWGALVVASVAAPTGTLLIQGLPFTCANNNSNYAAATVWINGANASATTAMMAFVNRNSAQIEVDHFATGTSAGAAADIKAATQVFFNVTYAAVTAT